MTWIEQLERVKHPDGRELIGASFRGVPFFVETSVRSGGRNNSGKDLIDHVIPAVSDLGKTGNIFSVEGYVIGDNYMRQRDALWDALQEVAGAGMLVHPYYGRNIRVQCDTVTCRETIRDGGMAYFSIQFKHAPLNGVGRVSINLDAVVVAAADEVIAVNSATLEEKLVFPGQPAFALQSLSDDLYSVADKLRTGLSAIALVPQELAKMNQILGVMTAQASSLIRQPAQVLTDLSLSIRALVGTLENSPYELLYALFDAYSEEAALEAVGDTPARIQERENQALFILGLRVAIISEACRASVGVAFSTIDEALATRTKLVDAIDILAGTANEETYSALIALRSSVLASIPGEEALSKIVTVHQFADMPSLALAYKLGGSTAGEADLVARNKTAHPGFMSGELKVMTDA